MTLLHANHFKIKDHIYPEFVFLFGINVCNLLKYVFQLFYLKSELKVLEVKLLLYLVLLNKY